MFNSPTHNAFTEGAGQLRLVAWVSIPCIGTFEGELLEANAETQKARIRRPGKWSVEVEFRQISCVSLRWDNGIVEKCFGAPKVKRPESIEYIQHTTQVQS